MLKKASKTYEKSTFLNAYPQVIHNLLFKNFEL